MMKVALLGAGKIGRMIARLLVESGDFELTVADADEKSLERICERTQVKTRVLNATRTADVKSVMEGSDAVISALSYRFNPTVAQCALEVGASYFDLTEDVATTQAVARISGQAKPGQIFMPQCGLAPGFVSIVAHDLTQWFDELETVHLRVGALPQFPSNELKYNLTWSTDGLINEYCNPCDVIHDKTLQSAWPLEGYEQFSLDGVRYEAFNTSGGVGSLCQTLQGKVRELNYKTIRYIGHRELMSFLLTELRLSDRRELLKEILEYAIPVTYQDVVVVFCSVTGRRHGRFVQLSDARKIYDQVIDGEAWSAIQITTASSLCAVLDLFREGAIPASGLVKQEEVKLTAFLGNRFGKVYNATGESRYTRSLFSGQDEHHVERFE